MRCDLGLEEHELDEVLQRGVVVSELGMQPGDLMMAPDALLHALDNLELDLEDASELRFLARDGIALAQQRGGALANEPALGRGGSVGIATSVRRRGYGLANVGSPLSGREHAFEHRR